MRFNQIVVATFCLTTRLTGQQTDIGTPPGTLVAVGGHRLHVLCSGEGAPTVVLEAGASAFAIDWTLVQQSVARTNRVCAYDRAGSGWSDPADVSSRETVARDLHDLLRAAGEHGPFVMVGASLGGIYVRLYQADYPDDVAGLVLVDPASEDRLFTYFNGKAVTIGSLTAEQYRSMAPQRPVAVPRRKPQTGAPFDKLPPALYDLRLKLDARLIASVPDTVSPEFVAQAWEQERAQLARLLQLRSQQEHPLGDLPVVVLTRGTDVGDGLFETHDALARQSTNSRHTMVAGSGHEIHLFQPNAVIQAIADVVGAVRGKTRLPPR
jgi:pimeloyl-ACP methyl ester carboxylesterase